MKLGFWNSFGKPFFSGITMTTISETLRDSDKVNAILSNGNLDLRAVSTNGVRGVAGSNKTKSSGKFYIEIIPTLSGDAQVYLCVALASKTCLQIQADQDANSIEVQGTQYLLRWKGVAIDIDNGKVFQRDVSSGAWSGNPETGANPIAVFTPNSEIRLFVTGSHLIDTYGDVDARTRINFGAQVYDWPTPAGYGEWTG